MFGRAVSLGKIIHGDDHATLKVKTSALADEVRKRLGNIAALLASPAPPDLVLNRHCAECEFQFRCRKVAVEKDDLSLLAGMSAKERQKLRSKGIFTVTQLSYTFRPRRRPKRLRDKREKYHHALKALAIREKKIHIVGSPELKIEGTPVYLDVEGLPDRDFYYLIGLRIGHGDSAVQHSLWADTVGDEEKIWREFLAILETVEKPVLIHYGSYENTFLKRMREQHGEPPEGSAAAKVVRSGANLITHIFAQIYFPGISNGLKDTADTLGFKWVETGASGLNTIAWRC
jgi:predicted RecB family nuclease